MSGATKQQYRDRTQDRRIAGAISGGGGATIGDINAAISAHEAESDPHPTYATDADLAAHEAAADPHPGYLTAAEGNAAYNPIISDSGWLTPTLVNSWVDFGGTALTTRYRKIGTEVRLRGGVKNGTATDGTTMFTLPSGYRPGGTVLYSIANPTATAVVQILSTGEVQCSGSSSNTFLFLDGITFTTD